MQTISATKAKNTLGTLIDQALREPIAIQRNGRSAVVIMSHDEYLQLKGMIDKIYYDSQPY